MTTTTTYTEAKELDYRETDGVEVTLLWYPSSDVASVMVSDARTGDLFELVLGDTDRAMDVFHHPYAYAALRGLEYSLPSREPAVAVAAA